MDAPYGSLTFFCLRIKSAGKLSTKGTMNRHNAGIIIESAKNISFLCEDFMKFIANAGPEVKQAKVIPAALALHSKDII